MTTTVILNLALSAAVFAVIVGLIAWSIATERGDRSHLLVRRPRRAQRAKPAPRFDTVPARGEAWPAR